MPGSNTLFLVITKFCRCFSLQKATPCFIFCFFHFCHVHAIHVSHFINRWCYQMMSLSNTLRVVSPEVIKGITIHSPCCHSWVSHLWDVAVSRILVFCVKWPLSADQSYQCNCTIVQSQTWWPVWDPQLEDELSVPMGLLAVMAACASKGQPELDTCMQSCNEKSCMCDFLALAKHVRMLPCYSSSLYPMGVYTITALSPTERTKIQRWGYLPKIMADVWPSWKAQSFLLQKCLLLHTPAIPLPGMSESGSWPWGMDRLAQGNTIKGFGEEMRWGGGGKIK